MPKLQVAIVGGGIGGLCLAVALCKYPDIKVDLYEATGEFSEIGAGVMFWGRTWKILHLLGLASDISKVTNFVVEESPGVGFDFRKSDPPTPGFQICSFEPPYGCIRVHRAHFLDAIVPHLPEGIAHFGKRLISYVETSDGVRLHFADGTTSQCDLLVGCDGIKSTVRKQMFESEAAKGQPHLLKHIEPVWGGTMAYRALIPAEQLREACGGVHRTMNHSMIYCGKSKHVVSYPVAKDTVVNVVAFTSDPTQPDTQYSGSWVTDCSRQDVLEDFQGWEPEVEQLLRCVDKVQRWAIHDLIPLPSYVTNRVALLGDAAHAMTPHQGAGAGQAIEDGYVLAHIFGDLSTTASTIPQALKAYERVRLPFANAVIRKSRENGLMYELNGAQGDEYDELGRALQTQWDWLWETAPEEEVKRGLRMLRESITPGEASEL